MNCRCVFFSCSDANKSKVRDALAKAMHTGKGNAYWQRQCVLLSQFMNGMLLATLTVLLVG